MTSKSLYKKLPQPNSMEEMREVLGPLIEEQSSSVIFLDLDGTLAPIMPRPTDVSVSPHCVKLIRQLAHTYLAVVVVTGRTATEANRILGNSEIAYIGNHGFETMLPGQSKIVCEEAQPFLRTIREMAEEFSQEVLSEVGVSLEDKTATLSFHYRRATDQELALDFLDTKVIPTAEKMGLVANKGRMVVEVKPPVAIDKGVSVGRLLDRLNTNKALYAGDDTTDIDALKELRKRRRRKGSVMIGVGVISREMPPKLPKFCDLLVKRVTGVESLLEVLAGDDQ